MSLVRTILYLLVGVFVAQIVFYFPNLPEIVASHFDGSGQPNGWMSRQNFVIFEAIILLIIIFEFTLLPFLIEKMPDSWINLPNKDHWLAKERRDTTFLTIRKYFEWLSVALLALFIAVNQTVFEANITRQNLSGTAMWLILGAFLVFIIVWTIKFVRRFKVKSI